MKRARVAHRTVMRRFVIVITPHRATAAGRHTNPRRTEFEGHAAFLASAESVWAAVVAALVAGRQECADHRW